MKRACPVALAALWLIAQWLIAQWLIVVPAAAQSPVPPVESRGAMLYATHCSGCHTKAMHWRENRLATDRAKLEIQVRRWQRVAGLTWSDDEVADVVRYLDVVYYRFPAADGKVQRGAVPAPDARRAPAAVPHPT
ncbi:MAG: cytochrome c [Betaproteobacteria bacterium]